MKFINDATFTKLVLDYILEGKTSNEAVAQVEAETNQRFPVDMIIDSAQYWATVQPEKYGKFSF